ncbi:MAG: hypothetical protein CMJ29_13165 [Phycisphaerae bacterium]|mgnify:FL=1|nr:hypothetical protein [Phycisphaerae bacterium]|tara:strand:- start:8 stop:268 length:261 start_codon:yes stop_codon:yes gene_type:complete
MRIWRIIHALRVNFSFLLMALLICEGLIAVPMMFIFPPAALLLVFLGLLTLALSIVVHGTLRLLDDALARFLGIEMPPIEGNETAT